jgi:hypothetical protein
LELNMITCNNYVSDLQGFQVDLLYTLSQSWALVIAPLCWLQTNQEIFQSNKC